jgi:hypothetical protein
MTIMNHTQRASLALLFVSISTVSAHAALSDETDTGGISIETTAKGIGLQHLDRLLSGENNSDLLASVLKQHATAAQPAQSTMDGHFENVGAEHPLAFTQLDPADHAFSADHTFPADHAMLSTPPAEAPNLSLTVAANRGLSGQESTGADSGASANTGSLPGTAPTSGNVLTSNGSGDTLPAAPVPLPASALLFASSLVALPVMRRKQHE